MTLNRRDFLKGATGALGVAALSSPAAALGQSDSSVMDYIRSNFQYDSNNTYFTDQAIQHATNILDGRRSDVTEAIDAFAEFTDLRTMTADDLPSLVRMTAPRTLREYGDSLANGMERIYNQIGERLPHEMMREWLENHLYTNEQFPTKRERPTEWYDPPQQVADYTEKLGIQFLYPDLLDLAWWQIPDRAIQPRSAEVDPALVEEIATAAEEGRDGLQVRDYPSLDRRYLYEYLQQSDREELLFDRSSLEQAYQEIMWQRQHTQRPDRQQQLQEAQGIGVYIPGTLYNQAASQLASTELTYIHLTDELITDETLAHLKELVLDDRRDSSTEWGGRVMVQSNQLQFKKDPVRKKEGDERIFWDIEDHVAPDFARWHAHAGESLANSAHAGPSHYDLSANGPLGTPDILVTPVGQRRDTLQLNIDIYKGITRCSAYTTPEGRCPWPTPEESDTYVVDFGIFEA